MRLIDADELIRIWNGCELTGSITPIVNARPTVDAVKHAKWEINIFDGGHSCSRCGSVGKKEYNYCPMCGAKMDEE